MPDFRINNMLFPGGKRKALTLSYDDGVVQDRRLTRMLDRYGVRATFNLNSAFLGRVERAVMEGAEVDISTVLPGEIPALYKNHEIATHGSRHSSPVDGGSSFLREVMDDREALEALVPYMVTGHAYPFGLTDEKVIAMLRAAGIAYARTVISTHSFDLPGDFLRWDPTCIPTNLISTATGSAWRASLPTYPDIGTAYGWRPTGRSAPICPRGTA